MVYRVIIQARAYVELDKAYVFAAKRAPVTAARWLDRFTSALAKLSQLPESWPLAPESPKMLFGRRPHVFRVLFRVDGDLVRILRIRRGSRRLLPGKELERDLQEGTE